MTADDERPAVWVIDPKGPSGATRYPGREHGRFVDDRGEHVIVLFDRGTVRDYRVVSPERVLPRTAEEPTSDGQES